MSDGNNSTLSAALNDTQLSDGNVSETEPTVENERPNLPTVETSQNEMEPEQEMEATAPNTLANMAIEGTILIFNMYCGFNS